MPETDHTPTGVPCDAACPEARHLCGRAACKRSAGHDGDHACTGDWQAHTYPAPARDTEAPAC